LRAQSEHNERSTRSQRAFPMLVTPPRRTRSPAECCGASAGRHLMVDRREIG
jgi:hypothetical protein